MAMDIGLDTPIRMDIGTTLGRGHTTTTLIPTMILTMILLTIRRQLTGIATTGTPIRHRQTLRRGPTGPRRLLLGI